MIQRAFTVRYSGRVRVLKTEVGISLPVTPEQAKDARPSVRPCVAIWDTGANGSVITKQVADELGLKPIGVTKVYHAQGEGLTNEYLANVALPNGLVIHPVRVTEGALAGCDVLHRHGYYCSRRFCRNEREQQRRHDALVLHSVSS